MKIISSTFIRCFNSLHSFLTSLYKMSRSIISSCLETLSRVDLFWLQLCYFVTLSMLGYFVLAILEPRNPINRPENYDLLFTSVSAVTVSSMSTVEMEAFSNTQLFCLAVLMLLGGEVFTSILELQFNTLKLSVKKKSASSDPCSNTDLENGLKKSIDLDMKYSAMKFLGVIVLSYFIIVQVGGFLLVTIYVSLVPSVQQVLTNKNLNIQVFSIVTTISTFTNCGFLPTNEGMIAFKKNLGLLIILLPLVLLGNTLFPVFLRLLLALLRKMSSKEELDYVQKNHTNLKYNHLLPRLHCWYLFLTSFVFIVIQFVLFMSIGWKSQVMEGFNALEKILGSLFQAVNTRHTGESVFDLSLVSPAIIVLIVTMMYLPAYTYFVPREDREKLSNTNNAYKKPKNKSSIAFFLLSPLPFLVTIIILICILESENMQIDPLNFSVLNIIFEVVSAYGNVGFSLGYSCKRQLQPNGNCEDASYGFAGRWSSIGKLLLVLVMVFGRLKKFHKTGAKTWKLSLH